MNYSNPNKVYEFECGWFRAYDFDYEADELLNVLNKAEKENDIQQYIKNNQKWFIPASIFECYDFGHHEAYIVPEQQLGHKYRADYMLIGRNSIGYNIVLVEFEDVNVDYKIKTYNAETEAVRKGIAQINDWKRWMNDNRMHFLRECIPADFISNVPPWGIRYCLVVSRREKMDNVANDIRGQQSEHDPSLKIITYDRLVDNVRRLSNGF